MSIIKRYLGITGRKNPSVSHSIITSKNDDLSNVKSSIFKDVTGSIH